MPSGDEFLRYGRTARTLHWLTAILILVAIILGFWASMIGATATDPGLKVQREHLLFWHKSIGVTILGLACVRLAWALVRPRPPLPSYLPRREQALAKAVHVMLYLLMFAMPISGIYLSQAVGFPVSWFGIVQLPDFVHPDTGIPVMRRTTVLIGIILHKKVFAYSLLAILGLHLAAVAKHVWIDRDMTVWRRMAPWRGAARRPSSPGATIPASRSGHQA